MRFVSIVLSENSNARVEKRKAKRMQGARLIFCQDQKGSQR